MYLDNFTGSAVALTSHTPDSGGVIALVAGDDNAALDGSGHCIATTGSGLYSLPFNPGTNHVEAVLTQSGFDANGATRVVFLDADGNGYGFQYFNGTYGIYYYSAFALGSAVATASGSDPTGALKFGVNGTSLYIKDNGGSTIVSTTDSTYTAYLPYLFKYRTASSTTEKADTLTIDATANATTATLSGGTTAIINQSITLTVTPNGKANETITPHSSGAGTFSPTSLAWSNTAGAKTFTYTPTSTAGSPHSISITTSGSLTLVGTPLSVTVYAFTPPVLTRGVVENVVGNMAANLSWTTVNDWVGPDATARYQLQSAPDVSGAPGSWSDVVAAVGSLTSYRDTLVSTVGKWHRVKAKDSNGSIAYSNQVSSRAYPYAAFTSDDIVARIQANYAAPNVWGTAWHYLNSTFPSNYRYRNWLDWITTGDSTAYSKMIDPANGPQATTDNAANIAHNLRGHFYEHDLVRSQLSIPQQETEKAQLVAYIETMNGGLLSLATDQYDSDDGVTRPLQVLHLADLLWGTSYVASTEGQLFESHFQYCVKKAHGPDWRASSIFTPGFWVESSMYNPETMTDVAVLARIVGLDRYEGLDEDFIASGVKYLLYSMTPDLMNAAYWGDIENYYPLTDLRWIDRLPVLCLLVDLLPNDNIWKTRGLSLIREIVPTNAAASYFANVTAFSIGNINLGAPTMAFGFDPANLPSVASGYRPSGLAVFGDGSWAYHGATDVFFGHVRHPLGLDHSASGPMFVLTWLHYDGSEWDAVITEPHGYNTSPAFAGGILWGGNGDYFGGDTGDAGNFSIAGGSYDLYGTPTDTGTGCAISMMSCGPRDSDLTDYSAQLDLHVRQITWDDTAKLLTIDDQAIRGPGSLYDPTAKFAQNIQYIADTVVAQTGSTLHTQTSNGTHVYYAWDGEDSVSVDSVSLPPSSTAAKLLNRKANDRATGQGFRHVLRMKVGSAPSAPTAGSLTISAGPYPDNTAPDTFTRRTFPANGPRTYYGKFTCASGQAGALLGQFADDPVVNGGSPGAAVPLVEVDRDGYLRARPGYDGYTQTYLQSSVKVNDGEEHSFAVTYDAADYDESGTATLYLDGTAVIDHAVIQNTDYGSGSYVHVEGAAWTRTFPFTNQEWFNFDGTINDLQVVSRVLSDDEIADYMGGSGGGGLEGLAVLTFSGSATGTVEVAGAGRVARLIGSVGLKNMVG